MTWPGSPRAPLPVTARLTLAGLAMAVAAGCATLSSPLPAAGRPAALATSPAPAPATARGPDDCGDPTISERPPAVMPPPGAMPAGTLMDRIHQRGSITVGVLADVPPFGYIERTVDEHGQGVSAFQGFDVDLAKEIAKSIFGPDGADETHLKFRAVTYAERIPVIQDGDVDIVVATMTTNCARRAAVDFSVPYYDAVATVLVLKDSPYTGMKDLGGRKVCAPLGTTSLEHVEDHPAGPVQVGLPTVADCLVALQHHEVEAISTDDVILVGLAQQDPQTRVLVDDLLPGDADHELIAVGVGKDHPEMTGFVNGVLARIVADGTWERLVRHHLWDYLAAFAPEFPRPPLPRYRD
ncbi:transporter substrate-binding domain-containing protein [Frankia sp. CNm7]|uniref:Transporter substrate-binding domain-containing protein n=1 Tax=Frankia nepalensis TaxID=1836974 RepID=A0A937RIX8_9ACTN|nr:transporter substrate-binding domain-containing protein [Frankia nepalensis]MBL7495854.1 transporter substrate-binding domain-containing protein [Frankia nepalensis]MBL7509930.1 transporter substrate-binding domain-containing protein [Frankia nepalensis]MBL7523707.1 transporter substrate-binding domain-containing protein [Frankia nepalensis]MBL7629689.1 transporter substrate-binding domain-containing protein [Frankia nepalensis]